MDTKKSEADELAAGFGADVAEPEHRAPAQRTSRDHSRRASLIGTIEGEIVPRLLMLCRPAGPGKARGEASAVATDPDEVETLARVLVAQNTRTACEFVEAVRDRGITYERICLGLLIPAANRLADRWRRQELSDQELTLGLTVLHAVASEIGGAADNH